MTRRSASAPCRWRHGVSTTGHAPTAAPGGRSCGGVGTRGRPGTGLATSTPGHGPRAPSGGAAGCGHGRACHGGMRAWPALRLARHRP